MRRASILLVGLVPSLVTACPWGAPTVPRPQVGRAAFEAATEIPVPYGVVSAADGGLHLALPLLSIDTRLGTLGFGLAWSSADAAWRTSLDARYDGTVFVAADGRRHDTTGLAAGDPVPGTGWRVLDATALVTLGGLVHAFGTDGGLAAAHALGHPYPRLVYERGAVGAGQGLVGLRQCTTATACSDVFDLTHDAVGRLVRVDDRAGRVALLSWDAADLLRSVRGPVSVASGGPGLSIDYGGPRVRSVTNPEGETQVFDYDGAGRLLEVRGLGLPEPGLGFAWSKAAGGGMRADVTHPGGAQEVMVVDAQRRLLRRTDFATGDDWVFAWEGLEVARETGPFGETRYTRPSADVLVTETPDGNTTTVTYATDAIALDRPFARPVARIDDRIGPVLVRTYDAAGRMRSQANGEGDVETFVWGSLGELGSHTLPDGGVVRYEAYGDHGHPTRVGRGEHDAVFTYDAVGNVVASEDPGHEARLPGLVSRRFDGARRLVELHVMATTMGLAGSPIHGVRIVRRSDGQVLRIERPYGGDLEVVYDLAGRPVERRERVNGTFQVEAFGYDAAGNLAHRTRANGMREEWDHDLARRVVATRHLRGGQLETAATFGWQGRQLASIDDSARAGIETRVYDAAGRLDHVVHPGGEVTRWSYDARSRVTAEVFEASDGTPVVTLGHTYDAVDRTLGTTADGVSLVGHVYEAGRRVETAYGNGLVRRATFDAETGSLTQLRTTDVAGNEVERSTLAIRPGGFGHIEVDATTTTSAGFVGSVAERYWLGGAGSVGSRVGSDFPLLGTWPISHYTHDELGNRTHYLEGTPFVWNAEHNRLQRAYDVNTPHIYAWDAAGFAVGRDAESIAFDAAGRLTRIGDDRFVWDVFGRPVEREVAGAASWFGWGGAIETDAGGTPRALDRTDWVLGLNGRTNRYRHLDFRGNVKAVSDDTGLVRTLLHYDAYGVHARHGDPTDRTFARGLALGDAPGDPVLLGHRPYDPVAGSFLAPDPVSQWLSQHAYALGNPVMLSDPSGLSPVHTTDGAVVKAFENGGGIVGAAAGGGLTKTTKGAVAGGIAGAAAGRAVGQRVDASIDHHHDAWTQPTEAPDGFRSRSGSPGAWVRTHHGGRQRATGPPTGYGTRPTERALSPNSQAVGRQKGCVGACPGPARHQGPPSRQRESSRGGSSGAVSGFGSLGDFSGGGLAFGCAGPATAAPAGLAAWLPLLAPLSLVLVAHAARVGGRARRQPGEWE